MKTSTKLLLIFFACVPASVWAYNVLLKKQLDANKLVLELRAQLIDEMYTIKPVKEFKHIVVDGTMVMGEGNTKERAINWQPRVTIGDYSNLHESSVRVLKGYEDVVKAVVNNDTLYISFRKNVRTDMKPFAELNYFDHAVRIRFVRLESFSGKFGQFSVNANETMHALKVEMSGSGNLDLGGSALPRADILLRDSATVNINSADIGDLYYNLLNKSSITLDQHSAKRFHPLRIDSTARMQVSGYANVFSSTFANK